MFWVELVLFLACILIGAAHRRHRTGNHCGAGVSPAKSRRNYELCGRDVRTTLLFHFPVKEEDYVLG